MPTHRIEEPARGFEDGAIIVQQKDRSSFFVKRNHVELPGILKIAYRYENGYDLAEQNGKAVRQ